MRAAQRQVESFVNCEELLVNFRLCWIRQHRSIARAQRALGFFHDMPEPNLDTQPRRNSLAYVRPWIGVILARV